MDRSVFPLKIVPFKFRIFNFKGPMRMCASTSNTRHVWLTAHETSTATPRQVSISIANSVQNVHWIATNG